MSPSSSRAHITPSHEGAFVSTYTVRSAEYLTEMPITNPLVVQTGATATFFPDNRFFYVVYHLTSELPEPGREIRVAVVRA